MIVTLAGHVDHGKTTLVKLLTGTDTDRLAEEQRRGLTIDLGFAYLHHRDTTVGFVDVPGHHRFIHNMVAGVAALQQALLVVAADDGPMPQTREHLQILQLLGVSSGVVALTKCDRVSASRCEQARAETAELLRGTFLQDAPVVATSSTEPATVARLRDQLLQRAAAKTRQTQPQQFRMAIDRVFSLAGTGVVATGTIHGGEVHVDDDVDIFPGTGRARVRGLRVQNREARKAVVGDRAALNLSGATENLGRGQWLAAQADAGHRHLVLDLQVLKDFPRPVRHWTPVHVYHATSHATAHLALLEGSRLQPGQRALAELVLDAALLSKRGDRLVIRDHGLERTLGGGTVLDNRPPKGRRRAAARLSSIAACALTTPEASLERLLQAGPVNIDDFQRLWYLPPQQLDELIAQSAARLYRNELFSETLWQHWSTALADECETRHAGDATLQGLRENDFQAEVPAAVRARILGDLVAQGRLVAQAGHFRPAQHRAVLNTEEQALMERLQPLLDHPQPPSLGDMGRTLKIPLAQLQRSIKTLAGKGAVTAINDKRIYLPSHVANLAAVAETLSTTGPFSARDFRDQANIGRNVAIDVLEYFDARGFTRRQGDVRSVVGERSQVVAPLR
jgi:selenocysteine-specific elongation factor